ncbi:MAG: LLM class flavin-dependent oxidoreductase [Deltaproteobacteria bacterium]|nr:LLM class flavin-dependent oxidoreductase [Deltaproteobacteria bacterium]
MTAARPRLGVAFTGGGMSVAQLVAIGRRAEEAGVDSLYLTEAWRSAWISLAALACATKRVRLGPYVLNAYGHSPFLTAMSAIDFDDLSQGRLLLGVGGGNKVINEEWQGIPHERVLTKMAEYVTLLRQVARTRAGERIEFAGKVHRMRWTPAVDPRPAPFPVYLAAIFPRMIEVAGRCADGLACGALLSAEYHREVIRPAAEKAAATANRDPRALGIVTGILTAVDADRERARRAAREAIVGLFAPLPHPYYEFALREQGFSAVADAALRWANGGSREAAVDAIPDACLDRLALAGTPAECAKRIADYAGVVDELVLTNVLPPRGADPAEAFAGLLSLTA